MDFLGRLNMRGHLFLFAFLCLGLQSCKQADFYEKETLSEIAKPGGGDTGGSINEPDSSGGNNTPNPIPGTGGGTTTPPVVVIPTPVPPAPPVGVNPEPTPTPTPTPVPPVVVVPTPTPTPTPVPPVIVEPTPTPAPTPVDPPPPSFSLVDKVEYFTQNTKKNGDVDILWVMDDSGSMADEQDALAQNFSAFISDFIKKDIDFRMAITTTDGTTGRNGKQIGNFNLLNSAEAKKNPYVFTNHFKEWIKVGTKGSGREQGLKTASAFLDRYQQEFLRKDAYLAVVFISDEEDQSENKVKSYVDRYLSTKSNPGLIKTYSIVVNKALGSWESAGSRYIEVSKATGGKVADIHQDFHGILQDMGGSIINLIDNFSLAAAPYQNKINVYVDNVKQNGGYTFDTQSRTLKFDNGNIPREGAQIIVKYQVQVQLLSSN